MDIPSGVDTRESVISDTAPDAAAIDNYRSGLYYKVDNIEVIIHC